MASQVLTWRGLHVELGGQPADAGAETRAMGAPDWLAGTAPSTSCVDGRSEGKGEK